MVAAAALPNAPPEIQAEIAEKVQRLKELLGPVNSQIPPDAPPISPVSALAIERTSSLPETSPIPGDNQDVNGNTKLTPSEPITDTSAPPNNALQLAYEAAKEKAATFTPTPTDNRALALPEAPAVTELQNRDRTRGQPHEVIPHPIAEGKFAGQQVDSSVDNKPAQVDRSKSSVLTTTQPTTQEATQPWQMTRREWYDAKTNDRAETFGSAVKGSGASGTIARIKRKQALNYGVTEKDGEGVDHKQVIEKALAEGKPVPSKILANYPDLDAVQQSTLTSPSSGVLASDSNGPAFADQDIRSQALKDDEERNGKYPQGRSRKVGDSWKAVNADGEVFADSPAFDDMQVAANWGQAKLIADRLKPAGKVRRPRTGAATQAREEVATQSENTARFPRKGDNDEIFESRSPGFYSQLERYATDKLPGGATTEGYKTLLNLWATQGKFKKDELFWTGVTDWLDTQTGKITKDRVLGFIKAGAVQVEEVELHDDLGKSMREGNESHKGTQFKAHQTPGGENYRELLLTLPVADRDNSKVSPSGRNRQGLWVFPARNGSDAVTS